MSSKSPTPIGDHRRKIFALLDHTAPLAPEADSPIRHYHRAILDHELTLQFLEQQIETEHSLVEAVKKGHLRRLRTMTLVFYIECFERYLKEVAAFCIDHIAPWTSDDRFDSLPIKGSTLAAHFGSKTLGSALCESPTWLNPKEVNDRFRWILSDLRGNANFYLFPSNGKSPEDVERFALIGVLGQIRHGIVHNVGILTSSDAIKLRNLAKQEVSAPRQFAPTAADLDCVKSFLDETVESCNRRLAAALAALLTSFHDDGLPLNPADQAASVARCFDLSATVAGITADPLPPYGASPVNSSGNSSSSS
jgi:hypothetical protein